MGVGDRAVDLKNIFMLSEHNPESILDLVLIKQRYSDVLWKLANNETGSLAL